MPTYELAIVYRALPKDKLKDALKMTANLIFQEGGVIRKLHNIGLQATPTRMIKESKPVGKQANYFVYEFDAPASSVLNLKTDLKKYESVVRANVYWPVTPIISENCKIEEETQIAPFRKEVKEMLKIAKKKQDEIQKVKVKPNHGLGFDPFPL